MLRSAGVKRTLPSLDLFIGSMCGSSGCTTGILGDVSSLSLVHGLNLLQSILYICTASLYTRTNFVQWPAAGSSQREQMKYMKYCFNRLITHYDFTIKRTPLSLRGQVGPSSFWNYIAKDHLFAQRFQNEEGPLPLDYKRRGSPPSLRGHFKALEKFTFPWSSATATRTTTTT